MNIAQNQLSETVHENTNAHDDLRWQAVQSRDKNADG